MEFNLITTCNKLLPPPELEDGQIEDRNKKKHSPSGQVVQCSEGVPQGTLELHPSGDWLCIEIRWIVSRGVKNITTKCQIQGDIYCGAFSQADFILNYFPSNFLSNSPFPPSLAGRMEQLKSPCRISKRK